MQNLKKALSLVMVAAMILGFCAIGGGAGALASDFTDADDVKYNQAVDVVTELGIMIGLEGAFRPGQILTRAELAVMICRVLTGQTKPILSDTAKASFKDMPSPDYDWAHPYVAYCEQLGIIAGDGGPGSNFRPGDPVTMIEAAKTLLVAMGYRADIAGFVGETWTTNVATAAADCDPKLFDGLINPVLTAGLTRDEAAQMLYNAILTNMVTYDNVIVADGKGGYTTEARIKDFWKNGLEGSVAWTLLEYKFGVNRYRGVIVANEFAGTTRGSSREGTTILDKFSYTFEVGSAMDDIGLEVDIFAKQDPKTGKWNVFGKAIPTQNNTVVEVPYNQNIANYCRNNGVTLGSNGAVTTYVNFNEFGASGGFGALLSYVRTRVFTTLPDGNSNMNAPSGVKLRVIDNTGDGTANLAIVIEPKLSMVTSVNSSGNITLRSESGTIDARDIVSDLKFAREDVVLYYKIEDTLYIEEPETYQGIANRFNSGSTTVTVDSTAISRSRLDVNLSADYVFGFAAAADITFASLKIDGLVTGNEYLFYRDWDGNALAWEEIDATASQYILVTAAGYGAGGALTNVYQVRGYLSDGSAAAVYNVNIESRSANAIVKDGYSDASKSGAVEWSDVFGIGAISFDISTGDEPVICRYTMNSAGVLTLFEPVQLDPAVTGGSPPTYGNNAGKLTAGQVSFGLNQPGGYPIFNVAPATTSKWDVQATGSSRTYRVDNATVIFYVTVKGIASPTEYKFSAVRIGTKGIVKSDKVPTQIAGIVKDNSIKAMIICTEGTLTTTDRKIGYFRGPVGRGTEDGETVYYLPLLTTNYVDGRYQVLDIKTKEDFVYDVANNNASNPARGFYEYWIEDGYYKLEALDTAKYLDDGYFAVVGATVQSLDKGVLVVTGGAEYTFDGALSASYAAAFDGKDVYRATDIFPIDGSLWDKNGAGANNIAVLAKDDEVIFVVSTIQGSDTNGTAPVLPGYTKITALTGITDITAPIAGAAAPAGLTIGAAADFTLNSMAWSGDGVASGNFVGGNKDAILTITLKADWDATFSGIALTNTAIVTGVFANGSPTAQILSNTGGTLTFTLTYKIV